MKRTLAAAMTAGAMLGLAGLPAAALAAPAGARPAPALALAPAPAPSATLRVVPRWTYQEGGKLAVIVACSQRADVRVVDSRLLRRPVTLRKGRNLLIKLTNKTQPGKYTITLFCTGKRQQIDSVDTKKVRILKLLGAFWQPDAPSLPKHFKPDVTVSSGPPAPAKAGHGEEKGR